MAVRPALALTLLLAAHAPAQAAIVELHANAGFATSIAGVTVHAPAGGGALWSPVDLAGDPQSGSLLLSGPAGSYTLHLCLRPAEVLPFRRHVFEFSLRAQATTPATIVAENIFALGGDVPDDAPCDGPWTAYLRWLGQSAVVAPDRIGASIPTHAFPLLTVLVQVQKADAAPLLIDDWSVRVDTDVIFRDDDRAAQLFTTM